MNLPPIGEGMFLTCMFMAIALGAILGFALGYVIKETKHSNEIDAIERIVRRTESGKKERAPEGPDHIIVKQADGREYKVPLPLRPC